MTLVEMQSHHSFQIELSELLEMNRKYLIYTKDPFPKILYTLFEIRLEPQQRLKPDVEEEFFSEY